ncbi:MAG TPA: cell division protein ZapA [Micropepsaceae bacterium]|nr:cell division protein ZapA [Micropepsaceae bacterium]
MPLVNVLVNGRAYTVACDEGEEDHVRELGQFVDKRVRELGGSVGQVGDARLLLMTSLVVADELSEALAKLQERENELAALKSSAAVIAAESRKKTEEIAAGALEGAAVRLEAIAARLAHA